MCFKRRKLKKKYEFPSDAKYQLKDFVGFKYKGELRNGHIRMGYKLETGEIAYQIQCGGEATWIASRILEKDITILIKKAPENK